MTLYLTNTERQLYDKLPADLKKAWGGEVSEEQGTAWETEEELDARIVTFAEEAAPEVREIARTFRQKIVRKEMDNWSADEIPASLLPTLLFVMGARGLSAMISGALQSSDFALDVLSALSEARHMLLKNNAQYAYA